MNLINNFKNLPREARDTLLILIAVSLVFLPLISYLPIWTLTFLLVLPIRAWISIKNLPLTKSWIINFLLIAVVIFIFLNYGRNTQQAGLILASILLILKTLELKARRDALIIIFLSFFTLISLFLNSQSLTTAFIMFFALWFLLATVVNIYMINQPELKVLFIISGKMLFFALPLMIALFLLFPRLPPLWGQLVNQARIGLSDEINLGDFVELASDDRTALRVKFANNKIPEQRNLYFRGPVLTNYDGTKWRAFYNPSSKLINRNNSQQVLDYEITLEPNNNFWLLTLESTLEEPIISNNNYNPRIYPSLNWSTHRPINEVLRYKGRAILNYQHDNDLNYSNLIQNGYLQLPLNFNPRTQEWGQKLALKHQNNHLAIIQEAMNHLRTGGYIYTLSPQQTSRDNADSFWFDNKDGFCEHIASAFVVLMRFAGIPARIVTGYHGGELNNIDNIWTVRQNDAHAWTEVWIENQGWTRVDPTSMVAPERTNNLQRLQSDDLVANIVANSSFLSNLRSVWEATNTKWNNLVLNYGKNTQNELKEVLKSQKNNWQVYLIIFTTLLFILLLFILKLKQNKTDNWQKLMNKSYKHLEKVLGIKNLTSFGNQKLIKIINKKFGNNSKNLQNWLLKMEEFRYSKKLNNSNKSLKEELKNLQNIFNKLSWEKLQ